MDEAKAARGREAAAGAFGRWLGAELRRLYDGVLAEPVPEEWTRLVAEGGAWWRPAEWWEAA